MRNSVITLGRIALIGVMVMAAPLVFAQEVMDYSWGTVVEISDGTIILQEYDYETEGYANAVYSLSADVMVENAASLDDINPGEDVEVGFIVEGQEKIVTTLYVENESSSEEE